LRPCSASSAIFNHCSASLRHRLVSGRSFRTSSARRRHTSALSRYNSALVAMPLPRDCHITDMMEWPRAPPNGRFGDSKNRHILVVTKDPSWVGAPKSPVLLHWRRGFLRPILFPLTLHRRCCRILELQPVRRSLRQSTERPRLLLRRLQGRDWSPCQCTWASQSLASSSYIMVRSSKPKSSGGPASGNKSPITC
jgi:hypothetical protein